MAAISTDNTLHTRLRHTERGLLVAEVGSTVVAVLQRLPSEATARALLAATQGRAVGAPGSILYVIEPFLGIPEPGVRQLMVEVARLGDTRYGAVACVIEGDSFQAAAVRAFTVGLRMAIRARLPFEMFATLQAAHPWMARHDPSLPALASLLDAVRSLRARIPGR